MTENNIQSQIRIELSKYGVVLRLNNGSFITHDDRHISSGLPKGTSDLLFIGNSYVAFIEVKSRNGRIREEQAQFLKRMKELGHRAGVARNVKEALSIIGVQTV